MSNEKIILQPKYVADFKCDGFKCNAKCCRNSWRIDIDMETYKKYQRIKNPAMRKLYILNMYDLNVPWDKKKIIELLGKFSKMFDHRKNFLESLVKETEIFEKEPLKLMQVLLRL